MHIEFIDLLRCPNLHEESWLVAAFYRMDGRVVIEGKLGCPICGVEYFIRDGVAVFDGGNASIRTAAADEFESDSTLIAALLDLSRPGMVALLAGEWARDAQGISGLTNTRIVALNSPWRAFDSDDVAEIRAHSPIPLRARSLNSIALDVAHSTPTMLAEAARLLRPRGRLVVRGEAELTQQFHELARDSNQVVAEYVGELVPLRR